MSRLTKNEGKLGRWYFEYSKNSITEDVENKLWAAFSNDNSFWLWKKDLLQSLIECGFPIVYEQYDF